MADDDRAVPRPRWRLPWPPKTLFLVVPLHLAAFVALYLGVVHLTIREVTQAHERDTRLVLDEALDTLHPMLASGDRTGASVVLRRFVTSHSLLELVIYGRDGRPVVPEEPPDPELAGFLRAPAHESYRLIRAGDSAVQRALLRITASDRCVPCHRAGELLGAAVISRDLSRSLAETRRRLRLQAGLLTGGWVLLVLTLNLVLTRVGRQAVHALTRSGGAGAAPPLALDPVALELYRSLRRTLAERARFEDHMERAERLATVGKLAAGLAHEIKNPIAGVQGALELLLEECTDTDRRDLFRRMLEELQRVQATLQSLLAFARPRPIHRRDTDVRGLLGDIAELLEPTCRRKGIRLQVRTAERLGRFPLDPDQIRQVLVNLATNAIEAVEAGGSVELSAAPLPGGDGIVLAVRDDGPGIPGEIAERLFEPFVTTKMHGTGLGLAVARRIVEGHGGEIRVASTAAGTTFHVVLPAAGPAGGEHGADPDRRG